MSSNPDIISVIGARPQFIKAAIVSKAIRKAGLKEFVVNTGQHYDENMSDIFVRELSMTKPDIDLGIGSGSHGFQTARGLESIEKILAKEQPKMVLVYGDTNATLAGALAAAKLNIPVAHVEAGLRSYNRTMPEEINRVVTDHISTLLFCPTKVAQDNLGKEGITKNAVITGDVMIDMVHTFLPLARNKSSVLKRFSLKSGAYALLTLHRPSNTDDPEKLRTVLDKVNQGGIPVLFPAHPRVKKQLSSLELTRFTNILTTEPLGYLDMLSALEQAKVLITDSGGLQKEAFTVKTPCLTFREETEWTETVDLGWNILVHDRQEDIPDLIRSFPTPGSWDPVYGNGQAAKNIVNFLKSFLNT